jgi:hypothetical protein
LKTADVIGKEYGVTGTTVRNDAEFSKSVDKVANEIGEKAKEAILSGDKIAMELVEIDENLMRNDLTVLEQGEHLIRRQELIGFKQGDNRFTVDRGGIILPLKTTAEIAQFRVGNGFLP